MKYKVIELTQTCQFCPSQWEIKLKDGRMIYIRYRWGLLSVNISEHSTDDIHNAASGKSIYEKQIGGEYDGVMEDRQMFSILKDIIKF